MKETFKTLAKLYAALEIGELQVLAGENWVTITEEYLNNFYEEEQM